MTGSRAVITAALTGAAFLALAFLGFSGRLPPLASVALALFPALAGAVAVGWRTRARWLVIAGVIALLAAAFLYNPVLAAHVSTLWFVEHVSINLLLAAFFGRTLLPGADPLVTRIARAMRPSMPPEVVQYTRAVTVAWTIYFVVMAALSVALYFACSIAVWSAFATFVSGPAVALMFLFEFTVRRRRMPESRASIAQSIAGFRALVRAPSAAGRADSRSPDA